MQYRSDIDGLRAIAVLAVVGFHYSLGPLQGGFVGVDIFFVISGFLITGLIKEQVDRGDFSYTKFYARRVRRLFPALFATLFASVVVAALLFSPIQMERFAQSLISSVLSLSNVLFWTEHGYFDLDSYLKPLLHTWSLSVEEQFYLAWPLTLVLILRLPPKRLLAVVAMIAAASFALNLASTNSPSTMFYLSPFRVFEFALGASLVWIDMRRTPAPVLSEISFLGGMALIAYAALEFDKSTLFPSYNALVPGIGTVLAIYGGRAKWTGLLVRNPVAVWVGKISYSLYLVHWPIIVFWEYYRSQSLPTSEAPSSSEILPTRERLVLLVVSVVLASLMYRFVEQPFRRPTGQSAKIRGMGFYSSAAMLTLALIATGAHMYLTHGWTWRLGERGVFLAELSTDPEKARLIDYGGEGCAPMGCTTKNRPHPDLIVIGDSHSRQYYAGFQKILPNLNVQFFEFSSCQFFSPTYTRDFRDYDDPVLYDTGCRSTRRAAFQAIRESGAPVIVGEYWGNFPMISETTGVEKTFSTTSDYMEFVAKEIGALQSTLGIGKVFVLGSVPTAATADAPLDCMGRTNLTMKSCATAPRSQPLIAAREEINVLLKNDLGSGVVFLDPFEALCDPQICRAIDEGLPVYSDATHLSAWGAQRVVSVLAPFIVPQ